MQVNRWWDVFFGSTVVVLAALNVVAWAPGEAPRIGVWVLLALLSIAYIAVGRRALAGHNTSVVFALTLIVGSGALVACSPNVAIVQAITFPMLWSVINSTRLSIVANVGLALAVSVGFLISLGVSDDNILQTAIIEGVSLIGSLALGLWITRIAHLSAERKELLDDLTAAQEQLAAANRDSGVTSERERLAREIHDTIAQSLTGMVMLAQRAQRELAAGNLEPLDERLKVLEETARDALVETRSLVAASAPVELGGGLTAALERLAQRFERETGIRVLVSTDAAASAPDRAPLDRAAEVVILRCAQESLANVRKHSGATSVSLKVLESAHTVELTVHDDGDGFDPENAATGFGLHGMRDRLALVNGSLAIASAPGSGTTLTVSLPLAVAL